MLSSDLEDKGRFGRLPIRDGGGQTSWINTAAGTVVRTDRFCFSMGKCETYALESASFTYETSVTCGLTSYCALEVA